ncbi:MAG: hypothetical protein RLZZ306_2880 [Bacteroidota bacterium]|jgi:hypothetical protein
MTPLEKQYNDILTQFGQFTTAATYITLVVAVFRIRYFNKTMWVFFAYIATTIFIYTLEATFIWSVKNYTSFWLPYLKRFEITDTNFLEILSTLKSIILITWFYKILLTEKWRKYVGYAGIIMTLFAIVDYIWITGYKASGTLIITLVGLFLVIIPMLYLWQLYKRDNRISIYKISYFWFSIALVIANLLGLFFYFVSYKIYETDFILYVKLSVARNVITILRYFVFAYGFWLAKYVRFLPKES